MTLGEVNRLAVKAWVKPLRRSLAEPTVKDVVTLLSMILARRSRKGSSARTRAGGFGSTPVAGKSGPMPGLTRSPVLACRTRPADGVLIITAAYTGMRWGELAGLQWNRVDLDGGAIRVDPKDGALHEVGGQLALGSPNTTAGARTVHLPVFLTELLGEHRERHPRARFVFTAAEGGWHRRANFRRRPWLPAVRGVGNAGGHRSHPTHFHGLRHTHTTWLIEDGVPEVVQHKRLGHKLGGVVPQNSHGPTPGVRVPLVPLPQIPGEGR